MEKTSLEGVFSHPASSACSVGVTDSDGVSIDDKFVIEDGVLYSLEESVDETTKIVPPAENIDDLISLDQQIYTSIDAALAEIFKKRGLLVLGGSSGIRGWSSIACFQRCAYLWRQTYGRKREEGPGPFALENGSLVHAGAAIYYTRMMNPKYPLEVFEMLEEARALNVNPDVVDEATRLLTAYFEHYTTDYIVPLAVEHRVADPKNGQSCRWDLIFELRSEEIIPGLPEGIYTCDHKTASRFDYATLNGWRNDGSALQQLDLYDRLKVEKRFGKLQGHLINLIGKQKDPKFARVFVPPVPAAVRDHRKSLRIWSAQIDLARELSHFPRSRGNCINRYGMCSLYDECAGYIPTESVTNE